MIFNYFSTSTQFIFDNTPLLGDFIKRFGNSIILIAGALLTIALFVTIIKVLAKLRKQLNIR